MTNNFKTVKVEFFRTRCLITFVSSNGCICSNLYKFKQNSWLHIKQAKQYISSQGLDMFYLGLHKLEVRGLVDKVIRKDWALVHNVLHTDGLMLKSDWSYIRPMGLFE